MVEPPPVPVIGETLRAPRVARGAGSFDAEPGVHAPQARRAGTVSRGARGGEAPLPPAARPIGKVKIAFSRMRAAGGRAGTIAFSQHLKANGISK